MSDLSKKVNEALNSPLFDNKKKKSSKDSKSKTSDQKAIERWIKNRK